MFFFLCSTKWLRCIYIYIFRYNVILVFLYCPMCPLLCLILNVCLWFENRRPFSLSSVNFCDLSVTPVSGIITWARTPWTGRSFDRSKIPKKQTNKQTTNRREDSFQLDYTAFLQQVRPTRFAPIAASSKGATKKSDHVSLFARPRRHWRHSMTSLLLVSSQLPTPSPSKIKSVHNRLWSGRAISKNSEHRAL